MRGAIYGVDGFEFVSGLSGLGGWIDGRCFVRVLTEYWKGYGIGLNLQNCAVLISLKLFVVPLNSPAVSLSKRCVYL